MLNVTLIRDIVEVQTAALLKAKQLAEKKPRHTLLKYARQSDDHFIWTEFVERFSRSNLGRTGQLSYAALSDLYAAYFLALCDACEEPDSSVMSRPQAVENSLRPTDVPY